MSPIRSCLSALATWRAPLPAIPPGLCEAVPHLFLAGFTPVPSFCSRLSPKQLISGRELALPIWGSGRGPGQPLTCCFWSLSAQEQPWTRGAWTLVSGPCWAGVTDKSLVIGSGGCPFYTHLILPRGKVYFDWLAGCKGSDQPGPVVCAMPVVTLKSPLTIMRRDLNNLQPL